MSLLSLIKPIIGKPDSTEDVKLVNALTAIEAWANGQIDHTNLNAAAGITEEQLAAAVKALLNAKTSGLSIVVHEASAEVKAGELFTCSKGLTATMPKAALNVPAGVWNYSAEAVKVKCAAGDNFLGDFLGVGGGHGEITLLPGQHITVLGDATKAWLITGGEPEREASYSAMAKVLTEGTEYEHEYSAYRETLVNIKSWAVGASVGLQIKVNGIIVVKNTTLHPPGAEEGESLFGPLLVPAGQKLRIERASGAGTLDVETSALSR